MPEFHVESRLEGTVATLIVLGELDVATSVSLQQVAFRMLESGLMSMRLDLSGVSFMDSSGLSTLVAIMNAAEDAQQSLALVRPSRSVARILRISGLDQVLEID